MNSNTKLFGELPDFKQRPLEVVQFNGLTGISYSMDDLHPGVITPDIGNPQVWDKATKKARPVLFTQTYLYFEAPDGENYYLTYFAPVVIYDKYHPVFRHLLDTLRWLEKPPRKKTILGRLFGKDAPQQD